MKPFNNKKLLKYLIIFIVFLFVGILVTKFVREGFNAPMEEYLKGPKPNYPVTTKLPKDKKLTGLYFKKWEDKTNKWSNPMDETTDGFKKKYGVGETGVNVFNSTTNITKKWPINTNDIKTLSIKNIDNANFNTLSTKGDPNNKGSNLLIGFKIA